MSSARRKALLAWSSGKDGALALHEVAAAGRYEIVSLLTTVTADYGRVSMHGVRRELLRAQAASLGYPLEEVAIAKDAANEDYEAAMRSVLEKFGGLGVECVIFGDIFLADLRAHREAKLAEAGLEGVFPLWRRDTAAMAREIVSLGFKAVVTCVDSDALDGRFAGRSFDEALLNELPPGVDPCGENGEFHSFVYDGPGFRTPVPCRTGRVMIDPSDHRARHERIRSPLRIPDHWRHSHEPNQLLSISLAACLIRGTAWHGRRRGCRAGSLRHRRRPD